MIYERIYRKLYRLIPNLNEIQESAKLKANGFMDLNVDILWRGEQDGVPYTRLALSHYYRHPSGDRIADPDMEISLYHALDWQMAEALTYQDAFGYRVVYPEPDKIDVQVRTPPTPATSARRAGDRQRSRGTSADRRTNVRT